MIRNVPVLSTWQNTVPLQKINIPSVFIYFSEFSHKQFLCCSDVLFYYYINTPKMKMFHNVLVNMQLNWIPSVKIQLFQGMSGQNTAFLSVFGLNSCLLDLSASQISNKLKVWCFFFFILKVEESVLAGTTLSEDICGNPFCYHFSVVVDSNCTSFQNNNNTMFRLAFHWNFLGIPSSEWYKIWWITVCI